MYSALYIMVLNGSRPRRAVAAAPLGAHYERVRLMDLQDLLHRPVDVVTAPGLRERIRN